MTKTEKAILGLLEYAKKEISTYYDFDSCVTNCKIALKVLNKFNIECFEVSVQVTAVNSVFRDFLIEHKRWPGTPEVKELIEKGAYSVGIGFNSPDKQWIGHLVCVAKDEEKNCFYLIDLSIDQASRPKHGIPIKPLAWPIEEKFTQEEDLVVIDLAQNEDLISSLFYYSKLKNLGYKESPNWNDSEVNDKISDKIFKKINQSIA